MAMNNILITSLDSLLQKNRPDYYSALNPGVKSDQLAELEHLVGIALPADFRLLYEWRNGQNSSNSDNFHANWMFMPIGDIIEIKVMLDEMIGTDFQDPDYWRREWIPFLDNGGGSYLCLDVLSKNGQEPGQLIAFWKADVDRPVKYASVSELIGKIVSSFANAGNA
ncbi:SMI1/KNR4 family protein [Undibacterium sp. Dicai25W]|uniref:SMI1/KNR4 family protein n=1 Tax=Undibacterium sp. Dicai25W TaxID=3413034 RepID=UPI003BEFA25F